MIITRYNLIVIRLLMPLLFLAAAFSALFQQAVAMDPAEKGPQDKAAEELLLRLQSEIREIRSNQINYVAEEEQWQEEYNKKGELKKKRKLMSNYYRVNLNDMDQFIECREVVSVDGKPTGDRQKLQELFFSKNKSAAKQIKELMKQSRKYDLGPNRFTNQPWVGFRFADNDRYEHAVYYTNPDVSDPGGTIQLHFKEIDEDTLFKGGIPFSKPMPATGQYMFASEGRQLRGYDISIHKKDGTILFRLAARYNRKKDGKLLPVSFEEYWYHKNGKIRTRSVSQYKNYRRFTSDVKIIPYE